MRRVGLIAFIGLATGVLTQLGQSVLPDGWSQAANAISPWLLVAFLLGAAMPTTRWAACAGVAALLLALLGYYTMTEIRYGIGVGTGSLVFWALGACVGGPIFGVAGRWWRRGSHPQRAAALGLLVAVGIAEGIYHAVVLVEPVVGAGFVIAGLLVPVILGRSRDDRIGAYVATVPLLVLGALGYVIFIWLYGLTAGI
jgi:hypothetical protein